jgi:hypothetical protein
VVKPLRHEAHLHLQSRFRISELSLYAFIACTQATVIISAAAAVDDEDDNKMKQ